MTETRAWPKDHPGRNCNLCGVRMYPIWIGDEPPPGTCPETADSAKECKQALGRLVSHYSIGPMLGKTVPEAWAVEFMQKTGITKEIVEAEMQWRVTLETERQALTFGEGRNALRTAVADYLHGGADRNATTLTVQQQEARFLELVRMALHGIDYCRLDLTLFGIQDRGHTLADALHDMVVQEIVMADYDVMETEGAEG